MQSCEFSNVLMFFNLLAMLSLCIAHSPHSPLKGPNDAGFCFSLHRIHVSLPCSLVLLHIQLPMLHSIFATSVVASAYIFITKDLG